MFVVSKGGKKVAGEIKAVFDQFGYPGGFNASGAPEYMTTQLEITGKLYDGELNSPYIDCGRTPSGNSASDEYRVNFAMFARMIPTENNSTRVEVVIDGTAKARSMSSNSVFCTGTGRLEKAVLQALEQRVKR